jgi:glycosyltransferase involved in cell wall biosynthesis
VTPAISVVMPAFNTRRFAARAIDSILDQTCADFEFIIVDDASTDGSAEMFRDYAARDARVRVLRNDANLGFVRSRNRGIEAARAALIANMDSDDIALPSRLDRQRALMAARPEVGVCGGDVILIDEDDREMGVRRYRTDDAGLRARLFMFNPFAQPLTMIRKRVLDEVGLYKPEYILADDLDLWFRIGMRHQFANAGEPLLKYRVHAASATGSRLREMQRAVMQVRRIARREYGYRVTPAGHAAAFVTRCLEIVPPRQRIAVFNWLRRRVQ